MKKEIYLKELSDLKLSFEKAKRALDLKYAEANNPHKVGDVITDHYHSIKITSWKLTYDYDKTPSLMYIGIELKKDGTPTKKQNDTTMYQGNIEK